MAATAPKRSQFKAGHFPVPSVSLSQSGITSTLFVHSTFEVEGARGPRERERPIDEDAVGAGPRAQAGAGEREAKCIRDLQGISESNKLQLRYSTVADVRGLQVKGCRFSQAPRR